MMKVSNAARPGARQAWRTWLPPLLLTLAAVIQLAGGIAFLGQRWQSESPPLLATSGVVLILSALVQLRIIWQAYRRAGLAQKWMPLGVLGFWCWLAAGLVVSYAVNLALNVEAQTPHVFYMAFSVWYLMSLLPLASSPEQLDRRRGVFHRRGVHAVVWGLFILLMTPLVAELGLRSYAFLLNDPIPLKYHTAQLKLPPGAEWGGQRVNGMGYWDKEFRLEVPPGVFRVAVVGDDLTLSGDIHTNFLAQLERRLPGMQIDNFGLPRASSQAYVSQVHREILRYQPDLVLAVVSVGQELTQPVVPPDWFDPRGLYLYQVGSLLLQDKPSGVDPTHWTTESESVQDYLQHCVDQLAICRTPIDRQMHNRWRELFLHFDQLVDACRAQNVPVGIVVSPSEFQVNSTLFKIVQRRAGYRPEELDLELPQRRLAQYVQQRELLMLDLLPYLRSSDQMPFERNQRVFNEHGHTLAARLIGHWIQSHFSGLVAATDRDLH